MPSRKEYKETINEILGLKEKSDFTEADLALYEKVNEEFGGKDWKEKLDSRRRENSDIIKDLEKMQKELREEHKAHLPEYRKRMEEYFRQKSAEYLAEVEKLTAKLNGDTGRKLTDEERHELGDLRIDCRNRSGYALELAEFAKNGTGGLKSIGSVGEVNLIEPSDPVYSANYTNIKKLGEEQKELDRYEQIRNAVGREKSDLNADKVKAAVEKYNEARQNFEKLSGWQRFWGKILPASWYKPAEQYREMTSYEEALGDVKIYPAEEAPVNAPVSADTGREALDEAESEKLKNDLDLDKSNEIEDSEIENEKQNDLEMRKK